MPEVVVYILEGHTPEQKRGLIKDITNAVVKNAGSPPEAVTVSLVETAKTSKGKGGVLQRDRRGARPASTRSIPWAAAALPFKFSWVRCTIFLLQCSEA